MPKIILKHKSPEYAEASTSTDTMECDMPGCTQDGDHKAPKHRGLNEYYHFCFEHAREYNKAWNFFSGMSDHEVQEHMHQSMYGDRPTWRYNSDGMAEDHLRHEAEKVYAYNEGAEFRSSQRNQEQNQPPPVDAASAEHEAMAIMGLSPPLTMDDIKTRYKTLAKKYHPDLNKNDPQSEELLKRVNMAYTVLKLAFEEYRRLPDHKF